MAYEKKPKVLCWELLRQKEYNYFHLRLYVYLAEVRDVEELIRGAVDRTNWTSPEVASRMERWYRGVLSNGYTEVYDRPWGYARDDDASFWLSWMEHDSDPDLGWHTGYIKHKVHQLGDDSFDKVKTGLELLDIVRKKVGSLHPDLHEGNPQLDDPKFVIEALEKMKNAVRVERLDRHSDEPLTVVRAKSQRMRVRSESVLTLMGW